MSFTSTAGPGNFCSQTYESFEQYKYATRQVTVHRIVLFALEYVIIIAGLGFGSLFCWALSKSTMIPKSCKILLFNLTASSFATTISRSIMIANFLREESLIPLAIFPYLSNFHDISINVNTFNQITLAAQCLVTTAFKDFDRNSDFVTSYLFMYAIISFPASGITAGSDIGRAFHHCRRLKGLPLFSCYTEAESDRPCRKQMHREANYFIGSFLSRSLSFILSFVRLCSELNNICPFHHLSFPSALAIDNLRLEF
ncbi:hypothetical protein DdX_08528 [Ditylenchus destructor]|uniref:Uncharacterized protein n=1 Tax=Ditylenchus destructor TaxID=166010 RepID=A0AAD4N7I8_9BILA|nr:hypothetical protein DdX_08528 [Ditylenchus destructor]